MGLAELINMYNAGEDYVPGVSTGRRLPTETLIDGITKQIRIIRDDIENGDQSNSAGQRWYSILTAEDGTPLYQLRIMYGTSVFILNDQQKLLQPVPRREDMIAMLEVWLETAESGELDAAANDMAKRIGDKRRKNRVQEDSAAPGSEASGSASPEAVQPAVAGPSVDGAATAPPSQPPPAAPQTARAPTPKKAAKPRRRR